MNGGRGQPASEPITRNIDTVRRMESLAQRRRTPGERTSDIIAGFVGTITFVALHVAWFACWAVINAGLVVWIPAFDPYPFPLLTMIVSMESVLMSTFVLIKQNRMGYISDRRDHLDLQVNLLSEREVTRLLRVTEQIGRRLGVDPSPDTGGELTRDTQVEDLIGELDRKL